ncbi:MAG: alpha/beta hydrolase-fold protein [Owenweeksia sp.]
MQKKNLSLVHEVLAPQQSNEKPPLLIMLHGFGSNEQDLFSMAPMLNQKFLIVSARAPHQLPWGGFAWYEINFEQLGEGKMSNIPQAKESVKRIETFVKEVQEAYGGDPENTWLMGFSQGCILSYAVAMRSPMNFKGVLALSGYILKEITPDQFNPAELQELVFFVSHGIQDDVLPVEWARQSVKILEKLNVEHQYCEYPMGHGVIPECFEDIKKWLKTRQVL